MMPQRDPFLAAVWLRPVYVTTRELDHLASVLELSGSRRGQRLSEELPGVYTLDRQAVMLTEVYRSNFFLTNQADLIQQAIEASAAGLHSAAVSLLISVIEHVACAAAGHGSYEHGNPFVLLARDMAGMAALEEEEMDDADPGRNERIRLLKSFKQLIDDRFVMETGERPYGLGRYGIFGAFLDRNADKTNFLRLLSVLDHLAFFGALHQEELSTDPPGATDESKVLAGRLERIRQFHSDLKVSQ